SPPIVRDTMDPDSAFRYPHSAFACVYRPPLASPAESGTSTLAAVAKEFSPRYECHRHDLVSIDVTGLERLLGPARAIGEELRREAAVRGMRVHVAVAGTCMAAMVLAQARPGVTIVDRGQEAAALATVPIGMLETFDDDRPGRPGALVVVGSSPHAIGAFK